MELYCIESYSSALINRLIQILDNRVVHFNTRCIGEKSSNVFFATFPKIVTLFQFSFESRSPFDDRSQCIYAHTHPYTHTLSHTHSLYFTLLHNKSGRRRGPQVGQYGQIKRIFFSRFLTSFSRTNKIESCFLYSYIQQDESIKTIRKG